MAEVDSVYNPMSGRDGVNTQTEKLAGGIGLDEKTPTATLRVFGSNLGEQWFMYGGIGGGTQDPPMVVNNVYQGCKWVRFLYEGKLEIAGETIFGDWKVTIEGDGLEPIAQKIGKQVKTTLMVGERDDNIKPPIVIRTIKIEPNKIRRLKVVDGEIKLEDEEEENSFSATC